MSHNHDANEPTPYANNELPLEKVKAINKLFLYAPNYPLTWEQGYHLDYLLESVAVADAEKDSEKRKWIKEMRKMHIISILTCKEKSDFRV